MTTPANMVVCAYYRVECPSATAQLGTVASTVKKMMDLCVIVTHGRRSPALTAVSAWRTGGVTARDACAGGRGVAAHARSLPPMPSVISRPKRAEMGAAV